jgi:hypothetical protein
VRDIVGEQPGARDVVAEQPDPEAVVSGEVPRAEDALAGEQPGP